MNKCIKRSLIILLLGQMLVSRLQAFDFTNDPNWRKFDTGCSRTYTTTIKPGEIRWTDINDGHGQTTWKNQIEVTRNGVTLVELKALAVDSEINLEFKKHSDGSTAVICTGQHDTTGHTLVMMIEPKNRYAYVYDTDSYVSEVVDLGEAVQIYKGKTLVPLRKFVETFGARVKYKGGTKYNVDWPSLHK